MSMGIRKSNKIRHIVRIRQMLLQWRRKAASSSAHRTGVPADVPEGHVAICVGSGCTRFVVRATYLNHPIFKTLLAEAAEEYGFAHHGPLAIPCEESLFQEILRFISRARSSNSVKVDNEFQRCCLVGYHNGLDFFGDSQPLLRQYTGKPVC
ncbi:PREDICTED: auxin-induced protein 6B-like [Ipomoea nil]|uniref:auxin-induced protein 6B-like n=1 Tax=Ipomoea nil TaxID=35883 RepID=UPI000900D31E|nr:PREDICTED: auxin-induced protein 6B-like [Ipomoea nil]